MHTQQHTSSGRWWAAADVSRMRSSIRQACVAVAAGAAAGGVGTGVRMGLKFGRLGASHIVGLVEDVWKDGPTPHALHPLKKFARSYSLARSAPWEHMRPLV